MMKLQLETVYDIQMSSKKQHAIRTGQACRALLLRPLRQDRLGFPVRVSMMEMWAVMSFAIDEKSFGSVAGYLRIMTISKRGLQCAQCLFFLDQGPKHQITRPENLDK